MNKTIKRPRQNLKRLFLFNALLLVIAFGAIQYSVATHEDKTSYMLITPAVEGVFKERLEWFETPIEMTDLNFKTVFENDMTLDDFKGEWIILNFWATWCPPCIVEMPSLQAMQDKYEGQGVKVVAVSLDRNMTGGNLRKFMNRYKFGAIAGFYAPWPDVKQKFDVKGLPTTYIITPDGKAAGIFRGEADWEGADATAFIESMIN